MVAMTSRVNGSQSVVAAYNNNNNTNYSIAINTNLLTQQQQQQHNNGLYTVIRFIATCASFDGLLPDDSA